MGYKIFDVRAWPFVSVRIHTGGLGTPTASQHNIFDSEKLSYICELYSSRGLNLGSSDLETDALPIEPPRQSPYDITKFYDLAHKTVNNQFCNTSYNISYYTKYL